MTIVMPGPRASKCAGVLLAFLAAAIASACSSDESKGTVAGTGGASGDASVGTGGREAGPAPDRDGAAETDGGGVADSGTDGSAIPPEDLLSSTGLYADIAADELASGVRPYTPSFVLWSDGATKRRFLLLPEGAKIDTSDMDYWHYPVGTKVWKEFTRDGVRVETRLLEKTGPTENDWRMMAFQWLPDGTDAVARPDGVQNASGTEHDIPSTKDCNTCHGNMPGRLLGVTAIQLSHDGPGVTLQTLMDEDRLSDPPAAPFTVPGNAVERAALGYLHANCGLCHNPETHIQPPGIDMYLWLKTGSLDRVENTSTYRSTVNKGNLGGILRIVPGDLDASEIHNRMSKRGGWPQMPPLGTELVDEAGRGAVDAWILELGAPPDAGAPADSGTPPDSGAPADGG